MNRREFIKDTATLMALSPLLGSKLFAQDSATPAAQGGVLRRDFKDLSLPLLGLGMMRLPTKGGAIDEAAVQAMVDYAIEHGVNYFDTAWGYHGGESELVAGRTLSKHPRKSYFLASKWPGYDNRNFGKTSEIFEKQLEKCKTDYFDFYLAHCLTEGNIDNYLNADKFGTIEYLVEQKKQGRIKHLGFSVHAEIETMNRLLDKYGEHMEFGQVQLNYMDYHFQHADLKVKELEKRGIAVWVMEPLRGGKLVNVEPDVAAKLAQIRPGMQPLEMAFRFLEAIPSVKVILSGMSNMEQLKENVALLSRSDLLTNEEFTKLAGIGRSMAAPGTVPCTQCRYCVPHCPMELDIPALLNIYNDKKMGHSRRTKDALAQLAKDKLPGNCIGCRNCERVCPQQIKISEKLSELASKKRH